MSSWPSASANSFVWSSVDLGAVQGHRDVQALAARRLHDRDHPEVVEQLAQLERDAAAVEHVGRRAGVEVEHDRPGGVHVGESPLVRVQLERSEIREPDERREVLDDAAALTAVRLERLRRPDPVGVVRGAALLEEPLTLRAIGRAHEGRRPAGQVRQHHRRNPAVVVDDVGLAETRLGVELFVEVGERELTTVDVDGDPLGPGPARHT